MCFPQFLTRISHLGRWMPAAVRKSVLENLYFAGVLDLDFSSKQVDARGNAEVCLS